MHCDEGSLNIVLEYSRVVRFTEGLLQRRNEDKVMTNLLFVVVAARSNVLSELLVSAHA